MATVDPMVVCVVEAVWLSPSDILSFPSSGEGEGRERICGGKKVGSLAAKPDFVVTDEVAILEKARTGGEVASSRVGDGTRNCSEVVGLAKSVRDSDCGEVEREVSKSLLVVVVEKLRGTGNSFLDEDL